MSPAQPEALAQAAPSRAARGSIDVAGVAKAYGATTVLSGLDLAVEAGTFVTLLGPSGCGKTTLLRLIAGFIQPSAGSIAIDGRDMAGLPPQRRPIGMVFQNLALFPHFSVEENVAYGLRLRNVPEADLRRKVGTFLDLVGLGHLGSRRISQLSGGQKQRVALARSLVLEPSILLLDEPLSALDLQLRKQLQVALKEIQRELGTTFVFVTHDQEEATLMSDRIVVMSAGAIQQYDTPPAIYSQPANLFVAKFVGELNEITGRVAAVTTGSVEIDGPGGRHGLPASGARGFSPTAGANCVIGLRPERITILPPDADASGRIALPGTVVERIALGPVLRFVLRCGEQRLVAVRLASDGAALPEAGSPCRIAFDPADAQLFEPLAAPAAASFGEKP
ncbi:MULTISPECIES: ABC transporter ATP-binding protein [Bosea]|uniref:ABC transporter ATP-binding protein n=1 Tax=Bosea TaxID=85413 RepID=UPI00214F9B2E|nr:MULTISPECIES: ABC transporter ATP-binding protein [Bosea]MCR4520930.1 ABC transporter ATP-binding protein [Bosea sp. 47.2.35]MDR6827621.1 ABC-type Fe3+/spermidine/putrescine transport system ATPase subunit [Bosea robiniae]MDR6894331.1 ABC-type Fe3+/spermidine/putrescine transport system ATPase subunit [Bosea sp. BE109]MDR7137727.1 ABC-type Fe3+/spermidine/putrescine transport system ATPase subunit [Bosea sp. BE168]MDR7174426.1 ABC-type Fe3+/spermidine/putrescine transport system ATPase subu